MTVHIHIDRVVVDDVDLAQDDLPALRRRLTAELATRLAAAPPNQSADIPRARADLAPGRDLASSLASSIHQQLRGAK